jgi:hypothetical protein
MVVREVSEPRRLLGVVFKRVDESRKGIMGAYLQKGIEENVEWVATETVSQYRQSQSGCYCLP